ncbi:AAA+ ATPase superfamily protein YifB/ComM, associated with DNA recombination [uncultured Gammaproteobacteria bacterium]|nr:AAA+ ATPase superfamily protein YifB/ComM, associated with DNA recombination [uncultured Gammaproteobacteria bacterium]CAC9581707.1 AAA+ ATPase superfamily protein YifB/ComM, associated with DNA recombination [uncultured Gammaproteobacteria bacterium]
MVLDVPPLLKEVLLSQQNENIENSETIRARVLDCYNRQLQRQGKLNDQLNTDEVDKLIVLNADNKQLSARAYHRILKVTRTIADLDHSQVVEQQYLIEVIGYRRHNG